ncbi:uncharacterized protein LOC122387336 [Amphibalanus amphitrite]|uniref:uncharacterized protein LOC122387336 n=1 Tax=Amphibalanus amphitrite TaxID=1232801 RepID=UPI001C90AE32|nr:uncharacterized protein LOC122387336 [Amphibalanus amphitrite]
MAEVPAGRPATRPMAIPRRPAGLAAPAESVLLRRRYQLSRSAAAAELVRRHHCSSEDEDEREHRRRFGEEGAAACDQSDGDQVDGGEAAHHGHIRRRQGAEPPAPAAFNAELPEEARGPALASSLPVELDVGQELRQLADSLSLSRSAPGALPARRHYIWTLIGRPFEFGTVRGATARPRPASGRP